MDPHELFTQEHRTIREKAKVLQQQVSDASDHLSGSLADFQALIRKHFKHEDSYYRILDDGKRVEDRDLVHQLRNDHAASIFTLESLSIRLRKGGVNAEWLERFSKLMNVLLPHLDQEEKTLFPIGKKLLSPDEISTISQELDTRE